MNERKKQFSSIFFSILFVMGTLFFFVDTPGAQTSPPPYIIGPDDVLNIHIWREPDLTRDVTVMADGRVTFPLIGAVMAEGQTTDKLKIVLTEKLKKYINTPEVTVIIVESRSRRIYTIGNLNTPGPYPLVPSMTVLQALSVAGGFAEWADTKNIIIIRRTGTKEIHLRFNYKDFISGKNAKQNIILKPSDTIVVP